MYSTRIYTLPVGKVVLTRQVEGQFYWSVCERAYRSVCLSLYIKDTLCILKTPLPIDWPLAQGMQKTQEGAYNEGKLTCQ